MIYKFLHNYAKIVRRNICDKTIVINKNCVEKNELSHTDW